MAGSLVLARDGTVLAATDGAPASWVGARVTDRNDGPEFKLTVVEAVPIRRVPTDLRALLRSALDVLRRQAKQYDVGLKIVVQAELPERVSLDPDKIAWAVTILVGNALRYVRHGSQTMTGGSITVRATYNAAVPETTIEVDDDGPGIPKETLPFLFTSGPDHARVGLGLLMVHEVVTAHGGRIDIESDPAQIRRGTTIRLTLPVS